MPGTSFYRRPMAAVRVSPCRRRWLPLLVVLSLAPRAFAQVAPGDQELLRQQERERALRQQMAQQPDSRLREAEPRELPALPEHESPCFVIRRIRLRGEHAGQFQWALAAADPRRDPASGRCLGTEGVNIAMSRVQNAIIARGYVTTRVLAGRQDLSGGELVLTLVPGRIEAIRFAEGTARAATMWNAVPAAPGELLNLRAIEQGLENFKRLPSVEADIQIAPAQAPGTSDLAVQWSQQRLARFNLSLDDAGGQSTGRTRAGATLSLDHALRQNDLFYVNLSHDVFTGGKRGSRGYTFHYSIPLGYWLLGASRSGYDYHQNVAGYRQDYLYSGQSHDADARVTRLLRRSARSKTSLYLRAWERDSRNYIDDTEVQVQRRRMGGWEAGLGHRHYLGAATLEANVGLRRGTGAFGALTPPEALFGEARPHPRIYFADAQWVLPFQLGPQRLRYTGNWRAQWTGDRLVPQDRFAIGGRYTVRGFDGELSLVGERGWLLRNEIGLALGGGQEFYVGADYGQVGGRSVEWQLGDHLAGAVLGLRGSWRGLSWDVFVGSPLDRPRGYRTAYTVTGFSLNCSF